MADAQLVVVHAFASRPEADVAVSALAAAGIDATIQADTGGARSTGVEQRALAGLGNDTSAPLAAVHGVRFRLHLFETLIRQRKTAGQVADFFADAVEGGFVGAVLERFRDQIGDL